MIAAPLVESNRVGVACERSQDEVLDAEVAINAILQTPKLQPASITRLVSLDEAIVSRLRTLEEAGKASAEEAETMRQLHERMLETMRSISVDPIA